MGELFEMRSVPRFAILLVAFAIVGCSSGPRQDSPGPKQDVETLFNQTTTLQANVPPRSESLRALAQIDGPEVDELLLRIVKQEVDFTNEQLRLQAVQALASRKVKSAAPILAAQVVPNASYIVRFGIVEALQELGCGEDCLRSVLHYLERVWQGERPPEDVTSGFDGLPADDFEIVTASIKAQREKLYSAIYALLRTNTAMTVTILASTYGLGSMSPSPFAIQLTADAQLEEACPALLETRRRQRIANVAPSAGLDSVIQTLQCEQ